MPPALPDLDAYFRRIGHAGDARPDLETLARLHRLHAAAIPFENLSAFLGAPVPLDIASLQEKLCTPGRGGWCFEQNLFFAAALEKIGFQVERLAARVRWNVPPGVVTPRSHMLLRVRGEGADHLADVGFGGLTLTAPLAMRPHVEQATPHEPHRLLPEGEGFAMQARVAGEWQTLYAFELHRQQQADYEVSNWYLANHPQSQFVNGLIAARAAPECRHALRIDRYAAHYPDGRTERVAIASLAQLKEILRGPLQLDVPESAAFDEKALRMLERAR